MLRTRVARLHGTRLARVHARRLSRASQPTLEYLNVYRETMADLEALDSAEPETVAAFFAAAVLPLRRAYAVSYTHLTLPTTPYV